MPLLGEPVEPARAAAVRPWWRAIAALEDRPAAERPSSVEEMPSLPPAAEGDGVEWPLD
jgi:hypothetical protein